jgi:hypothetical protein
MAIRGNGGGIRSPRCEARRESLRTAGSPQQAVVDGFFMMFKPLEPGEHTIVVHGTNTFGHDKTFNYYLTIE